MSEQVYYGGRHYVETGLTPDLSSVELDPYRSTLKGNDMTNWSDYQIAIFDWVKLAAIPAAVRRALVVEAVAGSGKTTTIVEAANSIPMTDSAVFLAFNKKIATELGARLPGHIDARTLNSIGHRAVMSKFGRVSLDASKVRKIVKELTDEVSIEDGESYTARYYTSEICSLVGKAKAHCLVPYESLNGELTTYDSWKELKSFYGVYSECPDDALFSFAQRALEADVRNIATIDFDDQLYFTVVYNIAVPQYDWIIVDEAQDLSLVNRVMLDMFLSDTGTIIAVGDSRQAIYGFRGADSSSMDNMVSTFNADKLPLSITYRCPRLVVEIAQGFVPEIQAADNAKDGVVNELDKFGLTEFVHEDLIVCRNTAPIVSTAYKLIRAGLPVRVAGRDIGKGLVSLVKKIAGRQFHSISMGDFEIKVQTWMRGQIKRAVEQDQEDRIEAIEDKGESILAIVEGSDCTTLDELNHIIEDLFNGTRGPMFSTVHRAKGLEADRVFILDPHLMPSKSARREWQHTQERNLQYVAVTRSLDTLNYLDSKNLS